MADRRWAIESATGLERGIAQQLVTLDEVVLDLLRNRLHEHGSWEAAHTRPTSPTRSQSRQSRGTTRLEDHTANMRLLTERRDNLGARQAAV